MPTLAGSEEPEPHKRKRDADDNGTQQQSSHVDQIPQPPPPQSGNGAPINYLSRASTSKLSLVQGGPETFSDVISLIDDYEGVLSRHESLAANLGAKPTAPRMLRAMEGVFEGPIMVSPISPQSPFQDPRAPTWYTPSWLDVVTFAKSNPGDFNLTSMPGGPRVCQFYLKNVKVEITEDDWRLIVSGALDKFHLLPDHPLVEDETAELATLEILEQRLQTLIKKADEVARKARRLNYHLSGRKASITTRLSSSQQQSQPGPSMAANQQPQRSGMPNPGYDLHADLLQQFLAPSTRPVSRSRAHNSLPTPSNMVHHRATPSSGQSHLLTHSSRPSPSYGGPESPAHQGVYPDDPSAPYRLLIQVRIDALARGDVIIPPCDRCRRRQTHCIKQRNACQSCTKKHAKCSWNGVSEEEVALLRKDIFPAPGAEEQRPYEATSFAPAEAVPVSGPPNSNEREGAQARLTMGNNNDTGAATGPENAPSQRIGGALSHLLGTEPDNSRHERDDMDVDSSTRERRTEGDRRGVPAGGAPSTRVASLGAIPPDAPGQLSFSRGSSTGRE